MTQLEELLAEYKKQSEDGLNVHVTSKGVELLVSALRECIGALEHYKKYIPPTRLITESSASYEREFGAGRVANDCLDKISKMGE